MILSDDDEDMVDASIPATTTADGDGDEDMADVEELTTETTKKNGKSGGSGKLFMVAVESKYHFLLLMLPLPQVGDFRFCNMVGWVHCSSY